MVGLVDCALVWESLNDTASLIVLGLWIKNRIFIQKTILDHVRVFDIEHSALK